MNQPIRAAFSLSLFAIFILACTGILTAAENNNEKSAEKKKPERDKKKLEEITFDDLKLDLAKDQAFEEEKLTERVNELHEQLVRIRGWILPSSVFQDKGIKKFVFVRDNMECCFGPGAAIYDCVVVEMEEGKTVDFTTRPVTIEGVFELNLEDYKDPDGKHYAIYYLRARRVK